MWIALLLAVEIGSLNDGEFGCHLEKLLTAGLGRFVGRGEWPPEPLAIDIRHYKANIRI